MQQKRLSLALALSFVVLFGWNILFPKPTPPPSQVAEDSVLTAASIGTEGVAQDEKSARIPDEDLVSTREEALELEEHTLVFGGEGERGYMRARFTNRGAQLLELGLGSYFDVVDLTDEERRDPAHWAKLTEIPESELAQGKPTTLALFAGVSSRELCPEPLDRVLWQVRLIGPNGRDGIAFRYAPGTGIVLEKRVLPIHGSYSLRIEIEIENVAAADVHGNRQFTFVPAAYVPRSSVDKFYPEPQVISVTHDTSETRTFSKERDARGKPEDAVGDLKINDQPVDFVGVHNKYFALLLRGAEEYSAATIRGGRYLQAELEDLSLTPEERAKKRGFDTIHCELDLALDIPTVGGSKVFAYELYAGPKDRDELLAYNENLRPLIDKDLGFFDGIATVLLSVLGFFHGITGNWGWSIILLTLSLRGLMFPITRRSQTSMARYQKKMKRVQPRINELKEKYKKDPQKLRQEQGKIMQEEGLFPPLGGCLPMFVQIPVFIGLFQALRTNFDLRHAPFMGWINDLSMPDRLARIDFNTHLPFLGTIEWLNVLPLLMVVFWIWHTRSMPKPDDEQAARMQKMMMWMPLMMGFFLYNYAAGLSLYMIMQSVLGIIETKVIKKVWPIDDAEQPKKKGGFMARMAEAQKTQMKRLEEQKRNKPKPGQKGGGSKKRKKSRT